MVHCIHSRKQNVRIPVAPRTVFLFPCGWRSAARRSSPSTCPQGAEALPRPLALRGAPPLPPPLSSSRTPTCARSPTDSAVPLSSAPPWPSLPAPQPVEGDEGRGGRWRGEGGVGSASVAFDQSHFIIDIRAPLRSSNNREIALPCFEMFPPERSTLSLSLSVVIACTSHIYEWLFEENT